MIFSRKSDAERAVASRRYEIARELRRIGVRDLKLYGTGEVVQPLGPGWWGRPRTLDSASAILAAIPEGASRTVVMAAWEADTAGDGPASPSFADRWTREGPTRGNRAESL
jgi:hypothetical protein